MRTDYKDFIASTENRHYRQVNNDDGTISLVDETVYTQEGDKVSAGVLNELSQNAIWPLQHTKSGTTHQLTGLTGVSGIVSCVFTATADFAAGDTVTVDGEPYAVQMPDGEKAPDKLFTSGASVSIVVDKENAKVNFKSAGGVKLPAGTFVIVQIYTNAQSNVSTNFIVPQTGTYRITVIGAGGYGGSAHDDDTKRNSYSGAGGGSGGWGTKTLQLNNGDSIPVTCNSSVSSFGSYVSAQAGNNGVSGKGGKGGTVSGADVSNPGIKGSNGEKDISSGAGGNGASVSSPNDSPFLTAAYGRGGSDNGYNTNNRFLSAYDPVSLGPFNVFGAGGGGGALAGTIEGDGTDGGPGAVIIELLLEGVNDT